MLAPEEHGRIPTAGARGVARERGNSVRPHQAKPASRPGPAAVISMTATHAALWGALLLYLGLFVPRLEKTFLDFNVKLPAVSEWVLSCSRWAARYPYLLPAALLCLLGADAAVAVLLRRPGRAWPCWAWLGLVTALTLAGVAVVVAGSLLPAVRLRQGLSK
jgi:hypothetical protein